MLNRLQSSGSQEALNSTEGSRIVGRRRRSDYGRKRPHYNPKSKRNLRPKPWPKGISGNPGGFPGTDLAAMYARKFFEAHPGICPEMADELRGFNAYGFNVLADRAYGKVRQQERMEHRDEPSTVEVKLAAPHSPGDNPPEK